MKSSQLPVSSALPTRCLRRRSVGFGGEHRHDLASVEYASWPKVKIIRNQNQSNTVNPEFAKTSRKCPPSAFSPVNWRLA